MSSLTCPICDEAVPADERRILARGRETLLKATEVRQNGKGVLFQNENLRMHSQCYKDYTRKTTLEKVRKELLEVDVEGCSSQDFPARRSQMKAAIDFKTQCSFCCQSCLHEDEVKKRVEDRREIHMCSGIPQIHSIRKLALERNDDFGRNVFCRLANAVDLVQTDGRYHHHCLLEFKKMPTSLPVGRPADSLRALAFSKVCQHLEENDECQYSINELVELMQSFMPESEPCYSKKHMKNKLVEHFGDRVVFTDLPGRNGLLCFRESADRLIHDSWYTNRKKSKSDERARFVEAAATILREEIKSVAYDTESFTYDGSDIEDNGRVPPLLSLFVNLLTASKKESRISTRRRLALCDLIISACRPRSFLSPLLLGLGIYLHRLFESRNLIDILHSVGFSVPYSEVKRCEHSLMVAPELANEETDGVVQIAFDNADVNVKTLDGHGTFHCMGGLMIRTPRKEMPPGSMPLRIKRIKPGTGDKEKMSGWLDMVCYQKPSRCGLAEITVNDARIVQFSDKSSVAFRSYCLDSLWMSSFLINESPRPNWNGYMEKAMANADFEVSSKHVLPFINKNPSDPICIYSALVFAAGECKKLNQPLCFVTFDLPLYNKAVPIVSSDGPDGDIGSRIFVKLGPFHLMMSFMGAIGQIMEASGLEEVWSTVYAKGSVNQMISGHHYSRAIRAHFLTQLALGLILLRKSTIFHTDEAKRGLDELQQQFLNNEITPAQASTSPVL